VLVERRQLRDRGVGGAAVAVTLAAECGEMLSLTRPALAHFNRFQVGA
jgi:hypothetical protein